MASETYPVQFISMNTRLGFINVKVIGDMLEGSIDRLGEPDNIYHSAIVAYDTVYEFVFDDGVTATTNTAKYLLDNTPIWNDGAFETRKTKDEFEAWVNTQKLKNFNSENYNVANNNCSHFTQAASEFLGGNEPEKHSSQRDWLIRNHTIAAVLQAMLKGRQA